MLKTWIMALDGPGVDQVQHQGVKEQVNGGDLAGAVIAPPLADEGDNMVNLSWALAGAPPSASAVP